MELNVLNQECGVPLSMDRYMTVRTHDTQISFGVDPCWAGFKDWLVVMDVDESSTPNTVRASEVLCRLLPLLVVQISAIILLFHVRLTFFPTAWHVTPLFSTLSSTK